MLVVIILSCLNILCACVCAYFAFLNYKSYIKYTTKFDILEDFTNSLLIDLKDFVSSSASDIVHKYISNL